MNNIHYAIRFLVILIFSCFSLFCLGCTPRYNYSDIETSFFSQAKEVAIPSANEHILNLETINNDDHISINEKLITISNSDFENFIIEGLNDYIFLFKNDAIVTVNQPIRTIYENLFISSAKILYIQLNNTLTSGTQSYKLPEEFSTHSTITANYLCITGANGKIRTSGKSCISATETNLACENLSINSELVAINSNLCSVYNNTAISAQSGIKCNIFDSFGGKLSINSTQEGIVSDEIIISNGLLNINAIYGFCCKNFIVSSGFLTLFADFGIVCSNFSIKTGYFYANCKTICIKSIENCNFDGGTTILVATNQFCSAIDAETASFSANHGILIANSAYAYSPQKNCLLFSTNAGDLFTLKNKDNTLVYIPEVSGSLLVAGNINYDFYSFNGRLVSYSQSFYGYLLNAKVNTYSSKSINSSFANFGAETYNGGNFSDGQLF